MGSRIPLFPELVPPRRAPRVLMRVADAGPPGAVFECAKCGHRTDWLRVWYAGSENPREEGEMTMSEAKRGIPCPKCNGEVTDA